MEELLVSIKIHIKVLCNDLIFTILAKRLFMVTITKLRNYLLTLIFIATATTPELTSLTVRLQSLNNILIPPATNPLSLQEAHSALQEYIAPGAYMPPHQPAKKSSYTIRDGSCHVWISADANDWTYHYCDAQSSTNMVKNGIITMEAFYYYCFMAGANGLFLEASQPGSDILTLNSLQQYTYKELFNHIVAATQGALGVKARYIKATFSNDIGAGRVWDC